ncbi:hypothetical protein KAI87_17125, partial [Myxococcota bacterium]|nr:hypothetical protein [Myxococcota bacterium]
WKERFGQYLIDQNLITQDDWKGVFEECKRTGANVGEKCVERGLISYEKIYQALLHHISHAFVSLLEWPNLKTMFVPFLRVYKTNLTFGCREFLGISAQNGIALGETLQKWLQDNPDILISEGEDAATAGVASTSGEEKVIEISDDVKESIGKIEAIKGFRAMAAGHLGEAMCHKNHGTLTKDGFDNLLRTMTQLFVLSSRTTNEAGFEGVKKMTVRTGDNVVMVMGCPKSKASKISIILVVSADANLVLFEHNIKRHIAECSITHEE